MPTFILSADAQQVTLHFDSPPTTPLQITARAVYENDDAAGHVLNHPVSDQQTLQFARRNAGRDLLYHRFTVTDPEQPDSAATRWVTGVSALSQHDQPMPWPASIKGVSNPEDVADMVELGVKHVHINLSLSRAILPADHPDPDPQFVVEVGDQTVRLNPRTIDEWDRMIVPLTEAGINVVAVILNQVPEVRSEDFPLVHPETDLAGALFGLGAFNLEDQRGTAAFIATLRFLALRYTHPDAVHGKLGGCIIGNEVDSHWTWHNIGNADLETIAHQYHRELRLAWLTIREAHPDLRVYASFTHSWARPNSRNPLKNCAGRPLLDRLHQLGRAGGDFGWEIAYHPYPQNLFQPRFWDDKLAMFGFDTPMVTFKNVELLPAYLHQDDWLYQGKKRSIILSEQGLHTPDGPDGETVQAAAYALAFHRIQQTGDIDAFILHRHVDAAGEGGLLLGVRGLPPTDGSSRMGHKKEAWHIFREAGETGWQDRASFAIKVAGYDSWTDADPRSGPFPERAPEWDNIAQRKQVFADLLRLLSEARMQDALQVSDRMVGLADGGMAEGVMLHPNDPPTPARLTYPLELPDDPATLLFATHLAKDQGDGVIFRVRINDQQVFEFTAENRAITEHRVDLSAYRNQAIELTLEVDPRDNNRYDESIWLNPAVVLNPAE